MNEAEEVEHKQRMLAHLQKRKKILSMKLPKAPPAEKEDGNFNITTAPKFELDKEFIRKKIKHTETRTTAVELDLARIREDLIEKELVVKQLSFLIISVRQKILSIPITYARKFMHKSDLKEIHSILNNMSYELLSELKDLPLKVTDPNWIDKLEEE